MHIRVGQKYKDGFGRIITITKVETNVTGYFHSDPYRIITTIHFKNDEGEEFHLDSPHFFIHYFLAD